MKTQFTRTTKFGKNLIRRRGFTLIEVLVVISITAVLALVVALMTRRVKNSALQAKSLNALRQVAVANLGFSTENNGDISILLDTNDPRLAGKYISKSFWGQLSPFLFPDVTVKDNSATGKELRIRLAALFSTTDAKLMPGTFQEGVPIYSDGAGLPVPFAFNNNVCNWKSYLKTTQYDNPSRVLHMSYGFYHFNEEDGAKYAPLPKSKNDRTNNIDYFQSKTAAFTFLDGHVEILSPPITSRLFGTKPTPIN
jgi:prepilin-type N-terminal cleavage/methylation domain-containing protein